jgi:hypothetical protein
LREARALEAKRGRERRSSLRRISGRLDNYRGLHSWAHAVELGAGASQSHRWQSLIFYTAGTDQITIVRVIDGRVDIEQELRR